MTFEIKRELTLEIGGGNLITKRGGNLSKGHLLIAQLKTLHAKTVYLKAISQKTVNENVKTFTIRKATVKVSQLIVELLMRGMEHVKLKVTTHLCNLQFFKTKTGKNKRAINYSIGRHKPSFAERSSRFPSLVF